MVFSGVKSAASVRGERRGITGWVVGGLVALLVIAFLAVPSLLFLTAGRPYGYFPFFFPFGFIIFFLFIFFAIRVLLWGWGWGWRGGWTRGYWRSGGYYWGGATEILRQRYARGEITKEQFEQMMNDLKAQGS